MKNNDNDLKTRLQIKEELLEQLDAKNKQLYNENNRLQKDKKNLEQEKDEALSRLSKLAGERLTSGNPNITDLGDPNRPAKIGERWSSLYTDEWTDAYEAIKARNVQMTNDDFEKQLLQIVDCCYQTCKENVEVLNQIIKEKLWDLVKQIHFLGIDSSTLVSNGRLNQECARENQVLVEAMQPFIEQATNQRRSSPSLTQRVINKCYANYSKSNLSASSDEEKHFVEKCSELCWFMCTTEPPMILEYKDFENQTIDSNKFNHYNRPGRIIQFVVWPVLLLYKDGPVLAKGAVQTYHESKKGTNVVTIDPNATYDIKTTTGEISDPRQIDDAVPKPQETATGQQQSSKTTVHAKLSEIAQSVKQSTVTADGPNQSANPTEGKMHSLDVPVCEHQQKAIDDDKVINKVNKQSAKTANDEQQLPKIDEDEQQSKEIKKSVNQSTEMVARGKKSLEISECRQQSTDIPEVEKYSPENVDDKQSAKITNDMEPLLKMEEGEQESIEIKKSVNHRTEMVTGDKTTAEISECKRQSNAISEVGGKQQSITTREQQSLETTTYDQNPNVEGGQPLQQSEFHLKCNTEYKTENILNLSECVSDEHTGNEKTKIKEKSLSANTERTTEEGEKYDYTNELNRNANETVKESQFEKDENLSETNDKYIRHEAMSAEQTNNTSLDNPSKQSL